MGDDDIELGRGVRGLDAHMHLVDRRNRSHCLGPFDDLAVNPATGLQLRSRLQEKLVSVLGNRVRYILDTLPLTFGHIQVAGYEPTPMRREFVGEPTIHLCNERVERFWAKCRLLAFVRHVRLPRVARLSGIAIQKNPRPENAPPDLALKRLAVTARSQAGKVGGSPPRGRTSINWQLTPSPL